ncbi:MAG TPA: PAS domain-containing protein [Thermoguttaceae bacterium]|nr:PAS domain-containing protein [Thermoguttaceae bacterium]
MSNPSSACAHKIAELLRQQVGSLPSPLLEEVEQLVREMELQQNELQQQNEELRKTNRHLEAYKDRYVDLYDFAPLGYVTLDEDGFVQEINLAGAKLLGAERDAVIGYAFGDHVAEEDREAFLNHVGQCVGQRREVTSELRLVSKDGRTITTQFHSIPIEGPTDDTLCKTAITDITERKSMEETIRRSRAFLQTVVDAIPDTMLVIGRDYRISLANRVARERAGGVDPTACLTCHQLSHHQDLPCEGQNEPCPLRQVIQTKAPVTVMHTHYDAEGNEVLVEVIAAPVFDEAGEVTHVIETCRDITDPKRLAASIAYDLRAPVSLLRQAVSCLNRAAENPVKWAEYLEVMDQQIGAIDRIASDAIRRTIPTHR